ncbi:MAG: dihydrofolate reductase family protein [Nocardioides sp.]
MTARIVYSALASLDLYVADEEGGFTWAMPDEAVHEAVNELERGVGTHLLGRRMYDVLQVWDTYGDDPDESEEVRGYAQAWRATDKVVYSRTLADVATARTRLVRELDLDEVRRMKETATRDLAVGGPELAGQLLLAGLVDDVHLFLSPVLVGGGTPALPRGVRLDLELVGERRFANGVVHLHHRVARG